MGKVSKIYPEGAAKNPDNVLEQAIGEYNEVCIIGYDKEGTKSKLKLAERAPVVADRSEVVEGVNSNIEEQELFAC